MPTSDQARARRLRTAYAALHTQRPGGARLELGPASTHEAITRQMVEDLREEVHELRGRINTLLWLVAGSVIVQLVLRVSGL